MSIKHGAAEGIETATARILLPVSATSNLKTGIFKLLVKARGEAYNVLAKDYGNIDRDTIVGDNGFYWKIALPITIVPVKRFPLATPEVDLAVVTRKLLHHFRKYGEKEAAVARSTWLNMRFSMGEYQGLVDGLELGGVTVHEYE